MQIKPMPTLGARCVNGGAFRAFLPLLMCAAVPLLMQQLGPTFNSSASYVLIDVTVLITAVLAISLWKIEEQSDWHCAVIVGSSFLLVTSQVVFSGNFPGHDSYLFGYLSFRYIASVLADGSFPSWFPVGGGVRIGFSHVNLYYDVPHRLLGYVLYAVLPVSAMIVYKLQYALGASLIGWGWWLVFVRWTGSRRAAYVGSLAIAISIGATFQQEQALATSAYLPWFVLAMLKMRESPLYLVAAGILLGLGVASHYPHVQLVSMGLAGVGLSFRQHRLLLDWIRHRPLHWLWAIALAVAAALPLGYVLYHLPQLASDLRLKDVQATTVESYEHLNKSMPCSSAAVSYLLQYVEPCFFVGEQGGWGFGDDRCAFFVGRLSLLLAALALIWSPRRALPVAAYGLVGLLLTLGSNSLIDLPKWLFLARVPGIGGFRQYYHFFPMVTVSLAALAVLGLSEVERLPAAVGRWQSMLRKGAPLVLLAVIGDLVLYGLTCGVTYCTVRPDVDLREGMLAPIQQPSLFLYKNRFNLNALGAGRALNGPWLTNAVVAVDGDGAQSLTALRGLIARNQIAVVVKIGPAELQRHLGSSGGRAFATSCACTVLTSGIQLSFDAPGPACLLTPMNYDLTPTAYLDGQKTKTYLANGAMTGVLVPGGRHTLTLHVDHDCYTLLVILRVALQMLLLGLFWRAGRHARKAGENGPAAGQTADSLRLEKSSRDSLDGAGGGPQAG